MNNPHAILIIKKDTESLEGPAKWNNFLTHANRSIEAIEESCILQDTAWAIDLNKDLRHFSKLVSEAANEKLSYQVLMMEDVPNWIKS